MFETFILNETVSSKYNSLDSNVYTKSEFYSPIKPKNSLLLEIHIELIILEISHLNFFLSFFMSSYIYKGEDVLGTHFSNF